MTLSSEEIQSVRFHLQYGNIGYGVSAAYTPDGFLEIFEQVVAPYLESGNDTSSSTTVVADSVTTITVLDATGIAARGRLVVDVGTDMEIVDVKGVSSLSVTARFAKAHTGTYPISTLSGEARLRMLLASADTALETATGKSITETAGLKQLGKGEIEWFGKGAVLSETQKHYVSICETISSLVRVEIAGRPSNNGRSTALCAY